jgi:alanyl-tRNA synthetase
MRNHTATHLLHAELRRVLGNHARQAGSLVAPDRLRFDFTHPEAITHEQLADIEAGVNRDILGDYTLKIDYKPRQQAVDEGAMALFGEKYGETVRTITIGDDKPFSYELCGGTHVHDTSDIGVCLIISESSVAAGIRRIEAVTGRKAYELIQNRFELLNKSSILLGSVPEQLPEKLTGLLDELNASRKQISALMEGQVSKDFIDKLQQVKLVGDIHVLSARLGEADAEVLRQMVDRYRQQFPTNGVVVLAGVKQNRPTIVAGITSDLTSKGLNAVELIKFVSAPLGGGGGGKPTLAQAGARDAALLSQALENVPGWVAEHFKG